jgi:DNA polymerase III epsilon subunit-like protein
VADTGDWAETYISFDLETDGPIPGHFSILSIGMSVAGRAQADRYVRSDPRRQTFYDELMPVTPAFLPEALVVSGLDRAALLQTGTAPAVALEKLTAWLLEVSSGTRPVLVAYPATFDWPFLAHYYHSFLNRPPPVPFTRVCDLRTLIVATSRRLYYTPTSECLPDALFTHLRHTHNALEDAIDQAELFSAIQLWRERGTVALTS